MPVGSLFETPTHKAYAWELSDTYNAITTLILLLSRSPCQPRKVDEWHVTECSALMRRKARSEFQAFEI